jgi:hypothetical protein
VTRKPLILPGALGGVHAFYLIGRVRVRKCGGSGKSGAKERVFSGGGEAKRVWSRRDQRDSMYGRALSDGVRLRETGGVADLAETVGDSRSQDTWQATGLPCMHTVCRVRAHQSRGWVNVK